MKSRRAETASRQPPENAMANPLFGENNRETEAERTARETLARIKAAETAAQASNEKKP